MNTSRRNVLKKAGSGIIGAATVVAASEPVAAHYVGLPVFTTADLNVREGPGLGYNVIHVAENRTGARILDGPESNDGYTWWYLEVNGDSNNDPFRGWAVQKYLAHADFSYPTHGYVTQEPQSGHWAVDISAGACDTDRGTDIVASRGGTVTYAYDTGGACGKMVKIYHGYGYETKYCHLNDIDVYDGQDVSRGQHIGDMGDTGSGDCVHLHFAIENDDYGNGSFGGMDWAVQEGHDLLYHSGVERNFPGIPSL